jgi:Ca-activated chloride channel family protein
VSFLAPLAFALLALLPVIVAMYLLKLRRTEQQISSVYLWLRMVRDLEANAPWQRLRRNLLLLLQLLFLLALILALARPFTWAEGSSSQAAIIILDTSASMAATDVVPSRMENARLQARQVVEGLPDDARVTVIAAGEGAQVLAASSQDRRQVYQAIDQVQVGPTGSDLSAALQLAAAIAARQPDAEVVVLSDGNAEVPERLAISGRVRYIPVGESGDNQAISLFTLERAAAGGALTGFVQVSNYGGQAAQRRLEIYAGDELVNAYDLQIPAGEQRPVLAEGIPAGTAVAEARLGGQDPLALDDRAWAVHRQSDAAAVTLVTDGNLFLETALGLLPNVELTTITPSDFEDRDAQEGTAATSDLTILDAYLPLTDTLITDNSDNWFFIAPPTSTTYFTVTGVIDEPLLRPVSASEPLLKDVNLSEVSVLKAARLALPDWGTTVIAGDAGGDSAPMLLAGEVDGRRLAVLAFDLHDSDLPLQVAFPLLISNLVSWLAPGQGGNLPDQVLPGDAVSLNLPLEVETASVVRPDGSSARYQADAGRLVFPDTGQLGVYRVRWGESGETRFAVNLFSPRESRIGPAASLPLLEAGAGAEDATQGQARREWWRPLAFAALGLLTVEWIVYQRATLVYLTAKARATKDIARR